MKNLRWSWGSIPSKLSYRRLVIIIICECNLVGWLGEKVFLEFPRQSIARQSIFSLDEYGTVVNNKTQCLFFTTFAQKPCPALNTH